MNRFLFFLIFLLLLYANHNGFAQSHELIILGNLTDLTEDSQFDNLSDHLKNVVGDYSIILPGDLLPADAQRLRKVLAESNAEKIIILPGDRDWDDSGPLGWGRVQALEDEVKSWDLENMYWPLKNGCPGPESIDIGNHSRLIVYNSQWFNHPYSKPTPKDGICKISAEGDFLEEIKDLMDENEGKNVLVAGHFPLLSLGPYGGNFPVSKWILPVPIISGLVTSYHQNVGRPEDIVNENFNEIRKRLGKLLLQYQSVISISGHEKNNQIIPIENNFLINSGNLFAENFSVKRKDVLLTSGKPGFITLELKSDGEVNAKHISSSTSGFKLSSTIPIMRSSCLKAVDSDIGVNQNIAGCADQLDLPDDLYTSQDLFTNAIAGPKYAANGFKELMLGKHYRETWLEPVKVPILDLNLHDGLTPFERGGGRQTKSLKLKAGNGYEYVFRSVDKDPAGALPYELKKAFFTNILRDQTTTQNPYGALAIDPLLNRLDILHAHPKLYVMPDASALGPYRLDFANMLGMIEERPTNPDDESEKTFADADKVLKSYKMFSELYDDHDNTVLTEEFLRARVFDLWVGDWGKHEDNWKWAGFYKENGKDYTFRPIPRDRDHVFSRWDGALPWIADREWAKSSGENFGYEIKDVKSLMWQARHLDRFLAAEADGEDWIAASKYVSDQISTEDISAAIKSMPPEVYPLSGIEIEKKLESRLNNIEEYTLKYYSLLAKQVDVIGSSKKEYFIINGLDNGNVEIQMLDQDKGKKGKEVLYSRTFLPQETQEIRLYGLRNDDIFELTGKPPGKILLRIICGEGDDQIIDNSDQKAKGKNVLVYDGDAEKNIAESSNFKYVKKADQSAYSYDRTSFHYNTYFPKLLAFYNADEGFILAGGVTFTNHKYGKPDYSSIHKLGLDLSTQGNFTLSYLGNFRHVLGSWDLGIGGKIGQPNKFNNFYGVGNESIKVQELFNQGFYRTRYNSILGQVSLKNEFWTRSLFSIHLGIERNGDQLEEDNIFGLSPEPIIGSSALDIARAVFVLDLDFRDRPNLSTKGMRLAANHESGWVLTSDEQKRYHKIQGSIEQFITTRNISAVTLGLRVGGSATSGDIPYYYRYYLGQEQNLRGYRKNRFTADKSFFFNSDLRWMISAVRTTSLPLGFGIRGFFDTGRVFEKEVLSDSWHTGYGIGIFIVPIKETFAVNISMAFSEEESGLLLLSIGKTFN